MNKSDIILVGSPGCFVTFIVYMQTDISNIVAGYHLSHNLENILLIY